MFVGSQTLRKGFNGETKAEDDTCNSEMWPETTKDLGRRCQCQYCALASVVKSWLTALSLQLPIGWAAWPPPRRAGAGGVRALDKRDRRRGDSYPSRGRGDAIAVRPTIAPRLSLCSWWWKRGGRSPAATTRITQPPRAMTSFNPASPPPPPAEPCRPVTTAPDPRAPRAAGAGGR